MERLTKRLEDGAYSAGEHTAEEVLAALGKYEDLCEGIAAEHELVELNLEDLARAGKLRSATYTMLQGSKFMLEEMQSRIDEPAGEVAARLENLKRLLKEDPEDDGIYDVEE